MAHGLELKVVAEGVETQAQMDFLKTQGCDEIQGYLISPPVEAPVFAALLGAGDGAALTASGRSRSSRAYSRSRSAGSGM